jgi:1-deoxy-D-xylulose-5-phosphate synthase
MSDHGYNAQVKRLGIPDEYIEHGEPHELWAECGFDEAGILKSIDRIAPRKKANTY